MLMNLIKQFQIFTFVMENRIAFAFSFQNIKDGSQAGHIVSISGERLVMHMF